MGKDVPLASFDLGDARVVVYDGGFHVTGQSAAFAYLGMSWIEFELSMSNAGERQSQKPTSAPLSYFQTEPEEEKDDLFKISKPKEKSLLSYFGERPFELNKLPDNIIKPNREIELKSKPSETPLYLGGIRWSDLFTGTIFQNSAVIIYATGVNPAVVIATQHGIGRLAQLSVVEPKGAEIQREQLDVAVQKAFRELRVPEAFAAVQQYRLQHSGKYITGSAADTLKQYVGR